MFGHLKSWTTCSKITLMNGTLKELTNKNVQRKAEPDSSACSKITVTMIYELNRVMQGTCCHDCKHLLCVGHHTPLTALVVKLYLQTTAIPH